MLEYWKRRHQTFRPYSRLQYSNLSCRSFCKDIFVLVHRSINLYGPIYNIKVMELSNLTSPLPSLPRKGGGVGVCLSAERMSYTSHPSREGLTCPQRSRLRGGRGEGLIKIKMNILCIIFFLACMPPFSIAGQDIRWGSS